MTKDLWFVCLLFGILGMAFVLGVRDVVLHGLDGEAVVVAGMFAGFGVLFLTLLARAVRRDAECLERQAWRVNGRMVRRVFGILNEVVVPLAPGHDAVIRIEHGNTRHKAVAGVAVTLRARFPELKRRPRMPMPAGDVPRLLADVVAAAGRAPDIRLRRGRLGVTLYVPAPDGVYGFGARLPPPPDPVMNAFVDAALAVARACLPDGPARSTRPSAPAAAPGVTAVGIALALLALLAAAGPAAAQDAPAADAAARAGSNLPCDVPLAWRVDRVDPRFGINADEVRDAARAAAWLWEDALGTRLFSHDPASGFPISLVHDERQAAAIERGRAEARVRDSDRDFALRAAELERAAEDHRRDAAAFERATRDFGDAVAAHNQTVRAWNQRGGPPADTAAILATIGQELDERAAMLERWRQTIEADSRRIQDVQTRLNQDITYHNRQVDRLRDEFPAGAVQSGVYREQARIQGGRVLSVQRAIDVFRFDDRDDLVRIIAHELGHALGLGHTAAPGALMSEAYGRDGAGPPAINHNDLRLFRTRCPGL